VLLMMMRCQPQLENHVTRPVTAFVRTILCALMWLAILENLPARADECLTEPDLKTPQDGHWYYRTDHATHLKCWYVGQPGVKLHQAKPKVQPLQRRVAQATPSAPSAAPEAPEKTNKTSWQLVGEPTEVMANIVRSTAAEEIKTSDRAERAGVPELAAPTIGGVEDEYLESSFDGSPPLIWPVLSAADLVAGAPRNEFLIKPEHVTAGLAAALTFIAIMISTGSVVHRRRRRKADARARGSARRNY
jgi:hypothetical protein